MKTNPLHMAHRCQSCLSRRRCLQLISSATLGLTFSGGSLAALAKPRKAAPDFVDPAALRPKPKVRVDAAILEMPRPYWLGWPGTTYDLDARQKEYGAKRVVEPTWEDSLNSARAYTTAKRLLADEQSNALSMDCLGMVGDRLVPTPPCGAWTILQDEGITAGCEADLHGATSLMLTSYLLDRPGFMNDPVAETAKNLLIVAHCTSGTRLNGFDKPKAPYVLRDHSESSLGLSVQVLWPIGQPVTLIRFSNPNELILDTGTVVSNVETPPAGGCRTNLEVRMDNIEDCRDVLGFHQVVTLGHHRRVVEGFCQLVGIKVVHSPPHTALPKA
ncbi:MAG: hypothetical protein HY735_13130 [Verrucomicrobia bacterium]|nr:hypothetical protein [Verrucomicrobiota bacterium]